MNLKVSYEGPEHIVYQPGALSLGDQGMIRSRTAHRRTAGDRKPAPGSPGGSVERAVCDCGVRARGGERGISNPALVFILAILAGFVYIGFKVFPFYYAYFEILGLMEQQAAK